jgi:hypothetical protein
LQEKNSPYDKTQQSVTQISISPDQDRRHRIKSYIIAMSIRTLCVILLVVVNGWLVWLFAIAAIFLPYFAVVMANNQANKSSGSQSMLPISRDIKPKPDY